MAVRGRGQPGAEARRRWSTTLAPGAWPAHAQPNDFWRMSAEGLRVLFGAASGFEVLAAGDAGAGGADPHPGLAAPASRHADRADLHDGRGPGPQGGGDPARRRGVAAAAAASEARARRYPVAGLQVAPADAGSARPDTGAAPRLGHPAGLQRPPLPARRGAQRASRSRSRPAS